MIEPNHKKLSVGSQCDALGLPRSSYYYSPKTVSDEDELLMKLLDRHYTEHPYQGKVKRSRWLTSEVNYTVGVRKVRSLMRAMGLETVYPKPNTSARDKEHKVYPYLLSELKIIRPNQVWAADITYLPLRHGHVYLFAIIDWHSRYVVDWSVSGTLEADYCVDTLVRALGRNICDIFNTDQGSQFTSKIWIDTLKKEGVSISMDGKGCFFDNIFIERLWRSVKQECIYLQDFQSLHEIELALEKYFIYYNNTRIHQGLNYKTPSQVYFK